MASKKAKILLGAAILADLAMTAAVFAKTCLPTLSELTDKAVELSGGWPPPMGGCFGKDDYEAIFGEVDDPCDVEPDPDDAVQERAPKHPKGDPDEPRDPIDQGIENILRFEVNGKTGFEQGE